MLLELARNSVYSRHMYATVHGAESKALKAKSSEIARTRERKDVGISKHFNGPLQCYLAFPTLENGKTFNVTRRQVQHPRLASQSIERSQLSATPVALQG